MSTKNSLKIGNLELKSNVILAPMAGLTDTVYRKLIRKYTADCLLTTEMLSSEAIVHNQKGNILKYEDIEKPLSFQLSDPDADLLHETRVASAEAYERKPSEPFLRGILGI